MQVTVISATEKPVDVISLAAGICYGKNDVREGRIRHCFNNGHLSVFEHAVISFRIEGISRACMAQLTRHRLVSFCVESQRYNRYDLSEDDWYVVPPKFESDHPIEFAEHMGRCAGAYKGATMAGVKPEDARYLLPEATKTNLIMTTNLRNLFHMFDMRMDKAAQWEICELAHQLWSAAAGVNEQWDSVMTMYQEAME